MAPKLIWNVREQMSQTNDTFPVHNLQIYEMLKGNKTADTSK